MTTRILPQSEWPRLSGTGCLVDKRWANQATRGSVVVLEVADTIIGTAFVFCLGDDWPHVDGLWIADAYRGRFSAQRRLYRGVQAAIAALGSERVISTEAAVWMRPQRGAHVQL